VTGLDWKTWTVIGLLLAAAAGQAFVYLKRQQAGRRAADAGNIFSLRQERGYIFFPAGVSYYRRLYIDDEGMKVETEGQSQELVWSQVGYVVKALNPGEKTLRNTYRLIFYVEGQDKPLILHLGSFREEEIRSIVKLIKKRVRLVEQ